METALLDWLARTGSTAFTYSAVAFALVNGAAIVAVVLTRDRTLVNRWTGRLLAANLVLLGTGLGVPMLTTVTRLGIMAASPSRFFTSPIIDKSRDASLDAPLEMAPPR